MVAAAGGRAHGNTKEMGMKIYVGSLSPDVNEEDLRQAFEAFGQVESASVVKDKVSRLLTNSAPRDARD